MSKRGDADDVEEDNSVFFQIPPKPFFDAIDDTDWAKMVRTVDVANFRFVDFGNKKRYLFSGRFPNFSEMGRPQAIKVGN